MGGGVGGVLDMIVNRLFEDFAINVDWLVCQMFESQAV